MEGEERDAKRKGDVGLRERHSERRQQRRNVPGEEIRVFEDREDEEISRDRDGERGPARRAVPVVDDPRGEEVEDDREQQDEDEARFSPGIENKGEQERDDIFALCRRGDEIRGQEDRQEVEQERYRGKDHNRNASAQLPDSRDCAWRGRHTGLPVRVNPSFVLAEAVGDKRSERLQRLTRLNSRGGHRDR